jgi:N-acetylglucosaminyldiphosphoundecaprenol N-acetyl-beta-D-mannosaminyltransferase
VVLLALGAPKQELWAHEHREALAPAVLIGVGATLDFLAGEVRRAPPWVSEAGLEWLYRLAQEPRRMAGRYLVRDRAFPRIALRTWLSQRRTNRDTGSTVTTSAGRRR